MHAQYTAHTCKVFSAYCGGTHRLPGNGCGGRPEVGGASGPEAEGCYCPRRAGIQDGDLIVKVNGRELGDSSELQEAVLNEERLLLEVRRGNEDLLFSIAPDVVL